jgi:tetratricopeptide (TPR) repeat protein
MHHYITIGVLMNIFSISKTKFSRYPQLAESWNKKGTDFKNAGRYIEAIKCYDMAIDLDSKLAKSWYNRGLALKALYCFVQAEAAFAKARELGCKGKP